MSPDPLPSRPENAATTYVIEAITEIEHAFAKWAPSDQRANKQLWTMLGQVYQAGHRIESDPSAKEQLLKVVGSHPELRKSNRWKPTKKGADELILAMILGLAKERKATRSQWLGALKVAKQEGIEPDSTKFAKWIEGVGGVIAARNSTNKPSSKLFELAEFDKRFTENLDVSEFIRLDLDPLVHLHEGYGVILIKRTTDEKGRWTNDLQVIGKIGRRRIVEAAARAVDRGEAASEVEEDISRVERTCLYRLNVFMLREAGHLDGKNKHEEVVAFVRAIKRLQASPSLREKFFDGTGAFSLTHDASTKKKFSYNFEVKNPEFHRLDPGRYFENARPSALMSFDPSGEEKELHARAFAFVRDYKEENRRAALQALFET